MANDETTQSDGLPVLETTCDECKGAGGYQDYDGWEPCYKCEGAGCIPTEAGEQILALVERRRLARIQMEEYRARRERDRDY